jgi:hypothetical protein
MDTVNVVIDRQCDWSGGVLNDLMEITIVWSDMNREDGCRHSTRWCDPIDGDDTATETQSTLDSLRLGTLGEHEMDHDKSESFATAWLLPSVALLPSSMWQSMHYCILLD